MIVLLDLNYTLVANSDQKATPFERQLANEVYRLWLVELLRPERVILITARPERHRSATMARIGRMTGWAPMLAVFNRWGAAPPVAKGHALREVIFPAFGQPDVAKYVGIESNPATRGVYRNLGIDSWPVRDFERAGASRRGARLANVLAELGVLP